MAKDKRIKKIQFNGNVYPYVTINVYDYDSNVEKETNVSTTTLDNDINQALFKQEEKLRESIDNITKKITKFVPHKLIINGTDEEIQKYIQEHN